MSNINWNELGSLVEFFAPQLDRGLKEEATLELAETVIMQAVGVPQDQVIASLKAMHLQTAKDTLNAAEFRFRQEREKQI